MQAPSRTHPEGSPAAHQPERTCVGCRGKKPVEQLVRLIRAPDGSLELGRGRPGRGAWLCTDGEDGIAVTCLEQAVRRRALHRAFRASMADDAAAGLRAKTGKRARMEGRDQLDAAERRED